MSRDRHIVCIAIATLALGAIALIDGAMTDANAKGRASAGSHARSAPIRPLVRSAPRASQARAPSVRVVPLVFKPRPGLREARRTVRSPSISHPIHRSDIASRRPSAGAAPQATAPVRTLAPRATRVSGLATWKSDNKRKGVSTVRVRAASAVSATAIGAVVAPTAAHAASPSVASSSGGDTSITTCEEYDSLKNCLKRSMKEARSAVGSDNPVQALKAAIQATKECVTCAAEDLGTKLRTFTPKGDTDPAAGENQ